jgi:hypothetical protein
MPCTPDAVRLAGFGGTWEGVKRFGPAEYALDISDFTRDAPSVIPLPRNVIRATHDAYPVDVTVAPGTNRTPNRAPWGLGANFIEFVPGGAEGSLAVSFDGMDGYAWRALLVMTPANGHAAPSVAEITLGAGSAGGATVSGFGTRWGKVTLVPTIADRPGEAVPFSYAADIQ